MAVSTQMSHQQQILQSDIEDKIVEVDMIQREIEAIRANVDTTYQQTLGRGRVSRGTNISIDNDRVQLLKGSINKRLKYVMRKQRNYRRLKI